MKPLAPLKPITPLKAIARRRPNRLARGNQIVAKVKRELDQQFGDVTPANLTAVLMFVQRRCREIEAEGGAR
jgi:hypothetical protein